MYRSFRRVPCLIAGVAAVLVAGAVLGRTAAIIDASRLTLNNVSAENIEYQNRRALKLIVSPEAEAADTDATFAMLPDPPTSNFVIEADVAGIPVSAETDARGFVGIAFRITEDRSSFEAIYLRPTNGRADDQVRRNRAIQYISHPDYPWHRLRTESPGQFESYVDLEPGRWTRMKIVVDGARARLFVNGAKQPNLIVNNLKLGERSGRVGLWVGPGSIAHFSNVVIKSIPARSKPLELTKDGKLPFASTR